MKGNKIYRTLLLVIAFAVTSAFISPIADFLTDLRAKNDAFWKDKTGTRLHLAFNQPEYTGGDSVLFSAFLINRQTFKPVSGKFITNLKLMMPSGEVIIHNRFMCTDGMGAGQLALPSTLESGNYVIQAYTDETAERNDLSAILISELRIAGEKEFTTIDYETWAPEGGNLIAGIPTRIAVAGMPREKEIRVLGSAGESIASFITNPSGTGSFMITPAADQQYFIQTEEGRKRPLVVSADGVALRAETTTEGKSVNATIRIPENSKFATEDLYLVMTSRGKICYAKPVTLEKELQKSFTIDCSDCFKGVASVNVFASSGVVASRLIYLSSPQSEVQITTDASTYGVRKPVKVDIVATSSSIPLLADASISVFSSEAFPASASMMDIKENLLINADLLPVHGTMPVNENTLDEYIIAQRTRISWEDILSEKKDAPVTVSKKPYYFKGKVVAPGTTIPDSTQVTFYLTSFDLVYRVFTEKGGAFEFPLFSNRAYDELFYRISVKGKELKDARVELAPSPQLPSQSTAFKSGSMPDPYSALSRIKGPIVNSFGYYAKKQSKDSKEKTADMDFDYDFESTFEKYKDFISMKEAIIEVIPSVRPRRENNADAIRVFIKETAMFAPGDPLIFIDGIITDSVGFFLNLPPAKVKKVHVLRSEETLNRFGDLGKNGILVVETRTPGNPAVPQAKHAIQITGISQPLPFRSPDYSKKTESRSPDLRTTLYWNPHITTDQNGKATLTFYTGDATGAVHIRLEGITRDGVPIRGDAKFVVKAMQP